MDLPEYTRIQGFEYYDLYEKILALARFVRRVRRDVVPAVSSTSKKTGGTQEEILKSMALSTYGANVNILVEMIEELYVKTVDFDKRDNGARPVYKQIPELKDIGTLLVNRSS